MMAECLELITESLKEITNMPETRDSTSDESDIAIGPGSNALGASSKTHKIQVPSPLSKNPTQEDVYDYVQCVNSYINRLGYHHKGEPGIRVITKLSLRHHMETARQIIKAGENIKCLHALLLGIYFTNCSPFIERFPINFRSKVNEKEYRHVVLGIYLFGTYGALGLSRDPALQDKPPTFTRLSELLADYCTSYEKSGHKLLEIKVGGVIPRDTTTQCGIPWRVGVLTLTKFPGMKGFDTEADKVARLVKGQMGQACIRPLHPSSMSGTTSPRVPITSVPSGTTLRNGLRLMVRGSTGKFKTLNTAVKKKPGGTQSKTILLRPVKTSSKLLSGTSSRSLLKSKKVAKNTKTKKKKVLKHKRFAEP